MRFLRSVFTCMYCLLHWSAEIQAVKTVSERFLMAWLRAQCCSVSESALETCSLSLSLQVPLCWPLSHLGHPVDL